MKNMNHPISRHFRKLFFALWLAQLCFAVPKSVAQDSPPNFIFILTDDQGWSFTSIGMDDGIPESKSDYFETPNIDRMARSGIRFSQAYSPASICSPSRRSILFGQTPARLGDESFSANVSPSRYPDKLTIPRMLKALDPSYRTAHYGKWDLRANIFPEELGYDESDGDTRNAHGHLMTEENDKWTDVFVNNDPKRMVSITHRAVNFIERQVRAGRPFYLQISHYAPHVDIQTMAATLKKYQHKSGGEKHHNPAWAAMQEDMDTAIGRILDKMENLGISDHTYIIFMSDNGGVELIPPVSAMSKLKHPDTFDQVTRNAPLRGGKWTLYEGGIRVPFIIAGPGIQPGLVSHVPIGGWDLLPTLAELVGYKELPDNLDGGSFAGIVRSGGQGQVVRKNDYLVFHRYHQGYPHSAIIQGEYKLIKFWKTDQMELYHIAEEIGERTDLAKKDPQRAKTMYDLLVAYLEEVNPDLVDKLLAY